jgi:hypothetical protein
MSSLTIVHPGRVGERSPQFLEPASGFRLPDRRNGRVFVLLKFTEVAPDHLWPDAIPP